MAATPLLKESSTLRRVVTSGRMIIRYTHHARQEMANDQIINADVRKVLGQAHVTWTETKRELLWHVEGKDLDGRSIRLVVAVYEEIVTVKVVTAMAL